MATTIIGRNLISQSEIVGTTVTQYGRLLGAFTVGAGDSVSINLTDLKIQIPPTLRLVIAGNFASGGSSDVTATLTWIEEI